MTRASLGRGIRWLVLILAGTAGLEAPAAAQPAPALKLEDAERMALASSPALRAAAARVRREEALLKQSQLYPDPDLNIDTSVFSHGQGWRETILSVQQRIPWHGKRGLERKEAEERIAAARADAETARLDLVLKVRESFYRITITAQILEVDRQNLQASEDIRKAVESRVAAGDAAPFEGLKAAVEVSRAESEVRQVQGEIAGETAVFNLLLGLPASNATELAATDVEEEAIPGIVELLERAGASQPELQSRRHGALAAEAAADRARLDPRPDVALGPAYGVDQGDAFVGLGLSLRLPIWNRGQGRIAAAEADRDAALADVEAARLSVASQVADAFGRYQSASRLKHLYEEGLLAQADALLDQTHKSYAGGESGILDLLDARRTSLAVKEEYYRACLDAAVAAARLERAVGEGGTPQ